MERDAVMRLFLICKSRRVRSTVIKTVERLQAVWEPPRPYH